MSNKLLKKISVVTLLFSLGLQLVSCNNSAKKAPAAEAEAAPEAKEPVKIGVLHSLSGTMAISEVSLKDVVEMAVEEINAAGGVLGKPLETEVVDPASDWDLFAEKSNRKESIGSIRMLDFCFS